MESSPFQQYPNTYRILRLHTERAADQDYIVFEIFCRKSGQPGEDKNTLRGRLTVSTAAMNLPPESGYTRQTINIANIKLPSYIHRSLISGFKLDAPDPNPLWILTDRPTGLLPAIPWERLLAGDPPKIQILRLPHLPLKPFMPRVSLDIALCLAAPAGPEAPVETEIAVLRAISPKLAKTVRVHVFGKAGLISRLKPSFADAPYITFYDPADIDPGQPEEKRDWDISNPWLLWMLSQVREDISFDAVQFVGHCSEVDDQGRLVFNTWNGSADILYLRSNAREIAAFLDRAGAWCATFISPPSNPSDAGMRLLVDQIAWLRPGPLGLFDLDADLNTAELTASNQFLLGRNPDMPASARTMLMCHPSGVGTTSSFATAAAVITTLIPLFTSLLPAFGGIAESVSQAVADRMMKRYLDRTTLAGRMNSAFESAKSTPNWLTSAQRAFERVLAQAADPMESEEVRKHAADAVSAAAEWLKKNAPRNHRSTRGAAQIAERLNAWRGR